MERLCGIVYGWLLKEVSDFIDQKTNNPAPLWRILLDPDRHGNSHCEDLEEHEVLDARA